MLPLGSGCIAFDGLVPVVCLAPAAEGVHCRSLNVQCGNPPLMNPLVASWLSVGCKATLGWSPLFNHHCGEPDLILQARMKRFLHALFPTDTWFILLRTYVDNTLHYLLDFLY